ADESFHVRDVVQSLDRAEDAFPGTGSQREPDAMTGAGLVAQHHVAGSRPSTGRVVEEDLELALEAEGSHDLPELELATPRQPRSPRRDRGRSSGHRPTRRRSSGAT